MKYFSEKKSGNSGEETKSKSKGYPKRPNSKLKQQPTATARASQLRTTNTPPNHAGEMFFPIIGWRGGVRASQCGV
jgi:hypothetical protein